MTFPKLCILSASLLAGLHGLGADLPFARLNTIFPPGGQAGTSIDVKIAGTDLDDATAIYFSSAGFASKLKSGEFEIDPDDFTIGIGKDVTPGVYEARVLTKHGASNPRRFVVGSWPEILEKSDETASPAGQKVPLGCTVNGYTRANSISHYRFAAKAGDRVLIEVMAKSIDSRMEPSLILQSETGQELARERRTGLLDYSAKQDGEFVLKLSDTQYRGGEIYFYRLTISTGPRIDFVLPRAAAPGSKGKFTLYGRNLPGGELADDISPRERKLQKLEVEIEVPDKAAPRRLAALTHPVDASIAGFEYRFAGTNGVSNPVFIALTRDPVVLERSTTNVVSAPVEFQGQFNPGSGGQFSFKAGKDSVLWLDVFGQRLGYPVSPFALLQKVSRTKDGAEKLSDVKEVYAADANLGGVDFNTVSRDGAWRFEVKEEGEYRVAVKDLFHPITSDPAFGYRLALRKETPDFSLIAIPQPPPVANKEKKEATLWTSVVRRGGTIPIRVLALRKDSFNDEIELKVENLPEGLSASPVSVEAGGTTAFVMIQAAANAPGWTGPIRIVGRAKVKDQWITREAASGSLTWQVEDYSREAPVARPTQDLVLSVVPSEISPVSVAITENREWKTNAAGKIQVPIRVARQEGFQAALKLKPVWNTTEGKETDLDVKATNSVLEIDLAPLKLPAGTHYVRLLGTTSGKYRKYAGTEAKALEDKIAAANKEIEAANKEKGLQTEAKKKAEANVAAAKKALADSKGETGAEKKQNDAKAALAAAETVLREVEAKFKTADDAVTVGARRVKLWTDKKNQTRDIAHTLYAGPIKVTIEGK